MSKTAFFIPIMLQKSEEKYIQEGGIHYLILEQIFSILCELSPLPALHLK